MPLSQPTDTSIRLESWRQRFEHRLEQALPASQLEPRRLHEAMRYSALAGGKRVRPMLAYASGHALGVAQRLVDPVACAVELIHAYSLIHDDLPAMDDDALRRGRATCHLAFDEATAILAGDALQALAFLTLAAPAGIPAEVRIELISDLARACGSTGMAGGQMLDLAATGERLSLAELEQIHRLKTGALIRLSVTAAATLARADAAVRGQLDRFGQCVGLGFQIRDDILDVTGDTALTGKPAKADAARNQPTFPALIGIDASAARAEELRRQALACLAGIDGDTAPLAWLADYMIQRDR
jgi:farnesyl diphosphate synthase